MQEYLVEDALKDIEEFCISNSWLNDIYAFASKWKSSHVNQWKDKAAFTIEVIEKNFFLNYLYFMVNILFTAKVK